MGCRPRPRQLHPAINNPRFTRSWPATRRQGGRSRFLPDGHNLRENATFSCLLSSVQLARSQRGFPESVAGTCFPVYAMARTETFNGVGDQRGRAPPIAFARGISIDCQPLMSTFTGLFRRGSSISPSADGNKPIHDRLSASQCRRQGHRIYPMMAFVVSTGDGQPET